MTEALQRVPKQLDCGGRPLDLSRPRVMGILNITPDSFSDGGRYLSSAGVEHDALLQQAEHMLKAGAAILDVGGESTRPGAEPVSIQQELDRVIPVIEALNQRFPVIVSVDTSNPEVMREAASAGAGMINDVRALQRPQALETLAELQLPVCIMHMQGDPGTMQQQPKYTDVCQEVLHYLTERAAVCERAGISANKILLDPGFGFGKTLEHNLQLLKHLDAIAALGYPLLAGLSRKSMIGEILNKPVDRRLFGSVAAATIAALKGAHIIRCHDVAETVDAIDVAAACL